MLHEFDTKGNAEDARKDIIKEKFQSKGLNILLCQLFKEIIMMMFHFSNFLQNTLILSLSKGSKFSIQDMLSKFQPLRLKQPPLFFVHKKKVIFCCLKGLLKLSRTKI